jgi:hypothetical protein
MDKFYEGFHRFAFEYWIMYRTNDGAIPSYRGCIRSMLHGEGANGRYWSDPAALMGFFDQEGQLMATPAVSPIHGLLL